METKRSAYRAFLSVAVLALVGTERGHYIAIGPQPRNFCQKQTRTLLVVADVEEWRPAGGLASACGRGPT